MTLGIISNQMVLDDLVSSLKSEGKKYLFAADGKMLTGHQVYNGKKMFFSESGALKQQVSLQLGKRLIQIGISMMRMG